MPVTLITGIDGFTGRYLAAALAADGHDVYGLTRKKRDNDIEGTKLLYACDLLDGTRLCDIIDQLNPTYVVHLAAVAFVAHENIGEMYSTNIIGTRTVLNSLAIARPSNLKTVLVASSANVYGNAREGVLNEDTPLCPVNDYSVTKASSEYVCHLYQRDLPLITARPFNYTGRGQSEAFLIPKIVRHAIDRKSRIELGNIEVARDFSDVRSVVDVYRRLLSTQSAVGKTLNVCSGRSTSLKSVLDMVGRISGHHFEISVNPKLVRANEVLSLCGSSARLSSLIGPLNMFGLEETLTWMLNGPAPSAPDAAAKLSPPST